MIHLHFDEAVALVRVMQESGKANITSLGPMPRPMHEFWEIHFLPRLQTARGKPVNNPSASYDLRPKYIRSVEQWEQWLVRSDTYLQELNERQTLILAQMQEFAIEGEVPTYEWGG